jgi:hypothetical protein
MFPTCGDEGGKGGREFLKLKCRNSKIEAGK